MRFVVQQGVAVGDHPGAGVVAGDSQRIAQRGRRRLWESSRHTAANHVDTAHAEGLQAIRRSHGEGAGLRQRWRVRAAAVAQVFLINRQLPTGSIKTIEGDRVIKVLDIQNQVRRAGIAVGIGQGVSEGLGPSSATVQIEEVRV